MTSTVLGHRGARFEAPENTLSGFDHLSALIREHKQITGVEFDVQLSRDGVFMVAHDVTLLRKAGLARRISDMSAQEIASINLEKLKKTTNAICDLTTPELSDVLPLIDDYSHIELEMKTHTKTSIDQMESALLGVRHLLGSNITITTFNPALLYRLKAHQFKTGWLMDTPTSIDYVLAQAKLLGVNRVCPYRKLITPELVDALHAKKIKVTAWTVNKKSQAKKLSDMGVDTLISDKPSTVIKALG